jgi:hypothetical protein
MFDKILKLFGGDVVEGVSNVIDKFVTTKAEKAEAKLELTKFLHQKEIQLREATSEEQSEFNKRIRELEGTASDLNQAGFFGKVILFFRGAQRPIWGFTTMYIDFMVFSGRWELQEGSETSSAFWIMNGLVLGFLFGERALLNLAPKLKDLIKK